MEKSRVVDIVGSPVPWTESVLAARRSINRAVDLSTRTIDLGELFDLFQTLGEVSRFSKKEHKALMYAGPNDDFKVSPLIHIGPYGGGSVEVKIIDPEKKESDLLGEVDWIAEAHAHPGRHDFPSFRDISGLLHSPLDPRSVVCVAVEGREIRTLMFRGPNSPIFSDEQIEALVRERKRLERTNQTLVSDFISTRKYDAFIAALLKRTLRDLDIQVFQGIKDSPTVTKKSLDEIQIP